MREPAWMLKYQAREALKNGRPEEAQRLLDDLVAAGDKRVWALRGDVVRGYLDRAERALRNDDVEAAWKDLTRVTAVAPADPGVVKLRDILARLAAAEIRAMLEAGKPAEALEAAARFRERPAESPALVPLEEAARSWQEAIDFADRGEFAQARQALERARPRVGSRTQGLDRYEEQMNVREDRFKHAWPLLQAAAAASDWREMLRCADDVLTAAPRHREAQQARNRAWQMLQPEAVKPTPQLSETIAHTVSQRPAAPEEPAGLPRRFFLWIDGVGAYLVCLANRVAIGQATADGPVDVPIFADVSRIHAALTRDSECYLLEASRAVSLNAAPAERAVLQTGDTIGLGNSCQMTFELPVPGGLSARLRLSGGRRLPMAVDGVLLMADMLVLGGGDKVHVSIPDLEKPLYLLKQKDQLVVKWDGEFRVEGEKCNGRGVMPRAGTVSADPFTFAIEPVR